MTRVWALDVDNTLYPASSGLFPRVQERIDRYLVERVGVPPGEVRDLRRRYRRDHGITLTGLMAERGVDPGDYLAFVHDVPHGEYLRPDPALAATLAALPGERVVFTNGSEPHARRVLGLLGIEGLVSRVFDIAFMDYVPKPRAHGYTKLLAALGVAPAECCLADDAVENLDTAQQLGMATILVGSEPHPRHRHAATAHDLGKG